MVTGFGSPTGHGLTWRACNKYKFIGMDHQKKKDKGWWKWDVRIDCWCWNAKERDWEKHKKISVIEPWAIKIIIRATSVTKYNRQSSQCNPFEQNYKKTMIFVTNVAFGRSREVAKAVNSLKLFCQQREKKERYDMILNRHLRHFKIIVPFYHCFSLIIFILLLHLFFCEMTNLNCIV